VNYDREYGRKFGQINNPPTFMDRNAGRPPRINQWNIAVQRELTPNLAVEAAYVGNRSVWLQQGGSWDMNTLTPARIAAAGLNINNAADRTLLTSPVNSAASRFTGIQQTAVPRIPGHADRGAGPAAVPAVRRPGSELGAKGERLVRRFAGETYERTSYGLAATAAYTRSKTLDTAESVNDQFNWPNRKALSGSDLPNVSWFRSTTSSQSHAQPFCARGRRRLDSFRNVAVPKRGHDWGSRVAE